MIAFTIPLEPVAKERPRLGRGGNVYTPTKTRQFEIKAGWLARSFISGRPLDLPLRLTVKFFLRAPKKPKWKLPAGRPDLDNFVKAITDSLNKILWTDDGRICELHAYKFYDLTPDPKPRIEMHVEEIE